MADKYPFTRQVEAQVALATCSVPRFHDTVGFALDHSRMPNEDAGMIVLAAEAVAKQAPCTSPLLAVQHLRWQVNQGQITYEQLGAASDLLDLAEDTGGVPDIEGLIAVVTPVVQHSLHKTVLEDAISDFGKGRDVKQTAEEFNKVATLGTRQAGLGAEGEGDPDDILAAAESTLIDPLPTGVLELDGLLQGGLEKRALGMVLANSGDGKSLFLSHVAAHSIFCAHSVAYVTLEINELATKQRIYCNLLNMTPDEMGGDPNMAAYRYQLLQARPEGLGRWMVCYMTPGVTTFGNINTWLGDLERERNFYPEVLIVDYVDKMVAKVGERLHSYEDQKIVCEGLRNIAEERGLWCWTASQSTGRQGRKKKLDLDDVADSMNKVRIADLVMAIVRTEDDCTDGMLRFRLPKRRNAAAHGEVGPLPMDAEHWRIVAVSRREPW